MPCPIESPARRFTAPGKSGAVPARARRMLPPAGLVLLCLAAAACSFTRLVPVQLARVHQTESYMQVFTFTTPNQSSGPTDGNLQVLNDERLVRRIDDVFTRLLGSQNWQNIKDLYGFGTIQDELVRGDIFVKGQASLTIYIDPVEQNHFLIEGMGRYCLIRDRTKEIMLSGDFNIPLTRHWLNELDRGKILIDVQLYVTRVPGQITYLNETRLVYELIIDKHLRDDHIYSVDYGAKHTVYLLTDRLRSIPVQSDAIGIMKLQNSYPAAKLIDLRGMQFLRDDYSRDFR